MSKLESVDEYNARIQAARKQIEEQRTKTGVACPKCGKELLWQYSGISFLSSMPPKRSAECKDCSIQIYLEA